MSEPEVRQLRLLEILERPGSSWTQAERNVVYDWLMERERYRQLLRWSLRSLRNRRGDATDAADAEEALADFLLKGLPGLLASFDPAKASEASRNPFWSYFLTCLSRSCSKYQRRLERQASHIPRVCSADDAQAQQIADSFDPETSLEEQEKIERIQRAIETMPVASRAIIHLKLQGKKTAEMAAELGVTQVTAKTRLSRARHMLSGLLAREDTAK